ncbi:MAG: DNA primase [Patescibacteria group bacterium]
MSSSVEQIKSRLDIVDVVGSYVKLQKAGINFKASCPFHHEKTPSFFVSPSRESWHCFGCNKGGDIFSFVMEIEGVEFADALKILAEKAGVQLQPVSREYNSERSRLLKIIEDSKKYYIDKIKENKDVSDYLKERGMEERTIKDFEIGYALDGWRNLYDFLKNNKYTDAEIEKTGMIIRSEKGYYDRFRNRIMFPINNSAGQTVGFSGRIFEPTYDVGGATDIVSQSAKYINNPQTVLYDKSKILYGFDKAKSEIRKNDSCLLVEGQMDVIMSHQAGVKNAVAVSGTALTSDHLRIIKRLTNNLAIAFDRDQAGFQASKRGIDMALSGGFDIKAVILPSGKDPADAVKEDKNIWIKAVEKAKNIIDFYLENLREKTQDEREFKKNVKMIILPYVAFIQDEIEKAHWIGRIANSLGIKEEPIWDELKKINIQETEAIRPPFGGRIAKPRLDFLKGMLKGIILWQKENPQNEWKEKMDKCWKKFNLDDFNSENQEHMVFEAELCYGGIDNFGREVDKIASEIEKEMIKSEREKIVLEIKKYEIDGDEKKISHCLNKINELNKKLQELK